MSLLKAILCAMKCLQCKSFKFKPDFFVLLMFGEKIQKIFESSDINLKEII